MELNDEAAVAALMAHEAALLENNTTAGRMVAMRKALEAYEVSKCRLALAKDLRKIGANPELFERALQRATRGPHDEN